MRYDRILHTALASPWSIQEDQLQLLARIFARRSGEIEATEQEIKAAVDNRRADGIQMAGDVAVLPLSGVIFPKSNLMTQASGATSLASWMNAYEALIADGAVKAVVLDIDSPGGSTAGLTEAADRMRSLAGQKPVVAVSNFLCASAAYFMAVQADQIVAAPSSITGSIGTIAIHENMAALLEAAGVDVTIISAGKYKAEGNPYEPLGDEAADAIQATVDALYGQFVKAVAQGRGATESAVRNGYGQARALTAQMALAENLVDRIESIGAVVARLQSGQARSAVMRRRHSAQGNINTVNTAPTGSNPLTAEQIATAVGRRMEDLTHA